ncbi:alpha-amylase family glycosyl hydrolase [Lysobacter antibioticus]|uniref:alpha-amylase family glycosyl hydrolase n=1 Tax=Lysobacter antibioticus TaxID=84531 RepID=UPI000349B561|nr:alpha-amylase family glycosyl hydrolase [Lysobacter antibioticus]
MSRLALAALALVLAGCATAGSSAPAPARDYYGTLEPMAADAVYFVVTDRFVNGDPNNDQREQGGPDPATRSFDRPVAGAPAGESDNIGYLGGDFKGLLDNAGYIRDMGFGAVWLTPIVDNPDQAFTGGEAVTWGGAFQDRGKTGYHGYWGVDFFRLDEHLPSPGLDFAALTAGLKRHGLKTVLDIVANHGSPSFTMPQDQPKYGEIYRDGVLVADHQNLPPERLDPQREPLHRFFRPQKDLVQLSNLDDSNPALLEYFVDAYSQWLDQGADALRIDTIRHVPMPFWRSFAARLRAKRPGLFMFGEAFDYKAENIAPFTWAENGGVSVLDFPLKERLAEVFGRGRADYARLDERLYLQDGPYANPYELMTFYDNHDMARLDASDEGFIDANHWLFTARGIPVIYYGSETGFQRGRAEHAGNRNYYGQARVDAGAAHPIHAALKRIARVRRDSPALQRGLQLNVLLQGDRAAFYRVYQHGDTAQIALVLLNKGDAPADFVVAQYLQAGTWRAAFGGAETVIGKGESLRAQVPAHGVQVYLLDAPVRDPGLAAALDRAMAHARRR